MVKYSLGSAPPLLPKLTHANAHQLKRAQTYTQRKKRKFGIAHKQLDKN